MTHLDDPSARPAPRVVVAAALVDNLARPTQLLAARRTEPPDLAGGWEFAGGKVEPGEQPVQALRREICEELGVQIVLGDPVPGPLPQGAWPLGDRYVLLVWLAQVAAGTRQPEPLEDHDELRWLDAQSLYSVPWLPADLPIVRQLEPLFAQPSSVVEGTPNA